MLKGDPIQNPKGDWQRTENLLNETPQIHKKQIFSKMSVTFDQSFTKWDRRDRAGPQKSNLVGQNKILTYAFI